MAACLVSPTLVYDLPAYVPTYTRLVDLSLEGFIASEALKSVYSLEAPYVPALTYCGHTIKSFVDVFYNHIWVIPSTIDVTGQPDSYTQDVQVWNSYFESKNLSSIVPTNLSGVSLTGFSSGTFAPLETKAYNFSLSASSPLNLSGNYQFLFSDAEDPYLLVSGARSQVFSFSHNWDQEIVERIAFLTDVIEKTSGKEQRVQIRKYPRRQFEYQAVTAKEDDRNSSAILKNYYDNQMKLWQDKAWTIPVWSDVQGLEEDAPIGTTTINVSTLHRDFELDHFVMLWQDPMNFELAQIDSKTDTSITFASPTEREWKRGIRVVPMRQALVGNDTFSGVYFSPDVKMKSLTWNVKVEDSNLSSRVVPFVPEYVYKGFDVFMRDHNYAEEPTTEYYKALRPIDFDAGIFDNDSRYKFAKERFSIKVTLKNREAISNFLGFLYERKGRLRPCWVPTYGNDVQIAAASSSGQSTITTKYTGYSVFINADAAKRDLMFIHKNGGISFNRIVGAEDNGDGTENLSLENALTENIDENTYSKICFIRFARLDADVTELLWVTNEWGYSNLLFLELNESPI